MAIEGKSGRASDRGQRLRAALRENLKRRKAQARGRTPSAPPRVEQASEIPNSSFDGDKGGRTD